MNFESPAWLHGLWCIPALLLMRWWAERQAAGAAGSLVATRLREWLISSASPRRAWGLFTMQILALAAFLVSLARPTWGEEKMEVQEGGKSLMFVLDTSRSMLAKDVEPNRLARAKLAAEDILSTLGDYYVGVVAFAGRGYLQAPLTSDHAAVLETLQALDQETIPRGGTLISAGIEECLTTFRKAKARSYGIVLFSDGGDEDPDLDKVLAEAKKENVIVMSIGVGTPEGSLIPDPDGGPDSVVVDPATGNAVHTRLDDRLLRKAAEATGGIYLTLGAQSLTRGVVDDVMRSIQAAEGGKRELTKPVPRFYWPLTLGIVLLMLSLFLRPLRSVPMASPATAALVFALVAGPQEAQAFGTGDDFKEARDAYEGQQYHRARDIYARLLNEETSPQRRPALAYGLAASAHQVKDYDRALENYSLALESPDIEIQKQSHKGLGAALYDQGVKALSQQPEYAERAWTDALRHFDAALAIHPDNKTARNRQHVKEQLDALKQQNEAQRKADKQKAGQGDSKEKQEGGEEQEGEENEEGQASDKGKWKDTLNELRKQIQEQLQKAGGDPKDQELQKQMQEFMEKTPGEEQQAQQQQSSGQDGQPDEQTKQEVGEQASKLKQATDKHQQGQGTPQNQPQGQQPGDQPGQQGQVQEMGQKAQQLMEQLQESGQEGEEGQEGQKPGNKGQKGEKEGKQGKEGQKGSSGEGSEAGDEKAGDELQPSGSQPLPEGQIQAGNQGSPEETQQRMQEMIENKIMEATGYSRNQARDLLKAYNDQMQTRYRQKKERPAGKDW
jgi:Ca-activated chloride channel family protein